MGYYPAISMNNTILPFGFLVVTSEQEPIHEEDTTYTKVITDFRSEATAQW